MRVKSERRTGLVRRSVVVVGAAQSSLLGTAIGDALGLPYEGLPPARAAKLLGPPSRYRFLGANGMVSDDTEHAAMTLYALVQSGGDANEFQRILAKSLVGWLLGAPAGVGLATLRAILRLAVGISPTRSGVFSAGNGPAMRAPIIGAFCEDAADIPKFVTASTRITHTDPKANSGAIAVAFAAHCSRSGHTDPVSFLRLTETVDCPELQQLLDDVASHLHMTTPEYAKKLGLERGVSGYALHTVLIVIHAWLRSPNDLRSGLESVIECGGDADTTAAILGGIIGAGMNPGEFPETLTRGLNEPWLHENLQRMRKGHTPTKLSQARRLPRNVLFLTVVLAHGFRRLLPPY